MGVVDDARGWFGTKYVYGAAGVKGVAADCSSFVQSLFKGQGVTLPRTTYDQVKSGTGVELSGTDKLANAQPGDLLFFNNDSHVGVYSGNGMMIDAPHTGAVVREEKVWTSSLDAIRRVTPGTSSSATTQTVGWTDTLKDPLGSATNAATDATIDALKSLIPSKSTIIQIALIIGGGLIILIGILGITESSSATPAPVIVAAGNKTGKAVKTGAKTGAVAATA